MISDFTNPQTTINQPRTIKQNNHNPVGTDANGKPDTPDDTKPEDPEKWRKPMMMNKPDNDTLDDTKSDDADSSSDTWDHRIIERLMKRKKLDMTKQNLDDKPYAKTDNRPVKSGADPADKYHDDNTTDAKLYDTIDAADVSTDDGRQEAGNRKRKISEIKGLLA
jgi:hypothetical protein